MRRFLDTRALMAVETERFSLRPLTADDVNDEYVSWWNDAEIQKGLKSPPRRWDRFRAYKHLSTFDSQYRFHLGIFCQDDGKLIGWHAVFINPKARTAKSNIIIGDKSFWGKGVVFEVRRRVLEILFDELELEKVKGEIIGRNYPSIFNYKQLGFSSEGVLRKDRPAVGGGRADVFLFGLLREEWAAIQGECATQQERDTAAS